MQIRERNEEEMGRGRKKPFFFSAPALLAACGFATRVRPSHIATPGKERDCSQSMMMMMMMMMMIMMTPVTDQLSQNAVDGRKPDNRKRTISIRIRNSNSYQVLNRPPCGKYRKNVGTT